MSTLTDLFTDIADAIRSKTGNAGTIVASDFPTAISNIVTDDNTFSNSVIDRSISTINYSDLSGLTTVGKYAFAECDNLTTANLAEGITTIDSSAFYACNSLETVNFPSTLTTINSYAFSNCLALNHVTLPETLTTLSVGAFQACKALATFTVPASVGSIPSECFSGCTSLVNVTIPEGITTVYRSAFATCKALTSIIFPLSLTEIKDSALYNCTNLTAVDFSVGITSLDGKVFNNSGPASRNVVFRASSVVTLTNPTYFANANHIVHIFVFPEAYNGYLADATWTNLINNGYVVLHHYGDGNVAA